MKRDIFQVLADPTRRAILVLIAARSMTPNALVEHFHTSRQAVSKHIQVLTESQLLRQEKSGRKIYYHFNPDKMKEVNQWPEQFRNLWENRFDQLDQFISQIKSKNNDKQG